MEAYVLYPWCMRKVSPILLLVLSASISFAKTAADLKRPAPNTTVRVIAEYSTQPQASHFRRVTDRQGKIHRTYGHMPMAAFDVTEGALAALENDPDVVHISPDREIHATLEHVGASVDLIPLHNYYNSIQRAKGGGIGIAIIDSGLDPTQPYFNGFLNSTSRIVHSESFIDYTPNDLYGHGTHVAAIASGMDNVTASLPDNLAYYWGMAPDASLINLKVLDVNGNSNDSTVIYAIDRAIALRRAYNIRVINLSLGRPIFESYKHDPLCRAVEQAWKAGIVVVVAAGNDGRNNSASTSCYGTISAPGNDPYVITVGAANSMQDMDPNNDLMTSYSAKGPTAIDHIVKPDLVAPGNLVISGQARGSTLAMNYPGNRIPISAYTPGGSDAPSPYYFTLSGTSMATPVVSGAAAFLIDKNPSITPDQVKAKLMLTCRQSFPPTMNVTDTTTGTVYTVAADIFTVGAGMVDLWAAYLDNSMPTGSAASPAAYYDGSSRSIRLNLNSTSAYSIIWGSSQGYGSSVIWGSNVSGSSVIWGSSIIWGSSYVNGFSVIWGSTSPWSDAATGTESLSILINGEQ
jgi:serine protease AprX